FSAGAHQRGPFRKEPARLLWPLGGVHAGAELERPVAEARTAMTAADPLLDDRRFEEWLDLMADDVRYWMPMRRNVKYGEWDGENTNPDRDMNWFDDD